MRTTTAVRSADGSARRLLSDAVADVLEFWADALSYLDVAMTGAG